MQGLPGLPYRERIPKLAKWAQLYIAKLERDIVSLEAERKRVEAGETPIYWSMGFSDEKQYLPDRAALTFITDGGQRVEVSLHKGWVHVRGYMGALIIKPQAPNAIDVAVERDQPYPM